MPPYTPDVRVVESVDLSGAIAGMRAPVLRLQLTTYAPGMSGEPYRHDGRPEAVFVLDGAIVDHRDGNAIEYAAGESYAVGDGTLHRMENRGLRPAQLVVAMVCDAAT